MAREIGTLFKAPMVRAILTGRKTQTRRAVAHRDSDPEMTRSAIETRIKVGDLLWVRETWRTFVSLDDVKPSDLCGTYPGQRGAGVYFEADGGGLSISASGLVTTGPREDRAPFGRVRAAIHLPRALCRLTLRVTDVRIERLQDISEADAIAEGIHVQRLAEWAAQGVWHDAHGPVLMAVDDPAVTYMTSPEADCSWHTARKAYRDLWETINGAGAWEANPWVAAYTFERVAA